MRIGKKSVIPAITVLLGLIAVIVLTTPAVARIESDVSVSKKDIALYNRFSEQMAEGFQLTESEKEQYLEIESRLEPDRERDGTLDNQGGPDAGFYVFRDNVAPDDIPYEWIELRDNEDAVWFRGLTHFTSVDDGSSRQKMPIGFSFPFYDATYDCVRVATNGFLQFGAVASTSLSNVCLPNTGINGPAIAAFWDDLHLLYGGRTDTMCVGYKNFGDYFVVEYDGIGFYTSTCNNAPLKFEVLLYNNGDIKLQYHTISFPATACQNSQTIGIQDTGAVGAAALNYVCNTTGFVPSNGLAILFARVPGVPRAVTNFTATYNVPDELLTWTDPTLDTQGNPITVTNIEVWLGAAGTGTLLGTVAAGVQSYTHFNAPYGNFTYTLRPFLSPYYGTAVSLPVTIGTPGYNNNFTTDNGQWTPTPATGGWEWGIPWGIAGLIPHSTPNVWGTVVAGNYTDNACWKLDLNLGLVVTSEVATVEFWHWFYSQSSYDGCNFKASVDNGATWTVLTPSQGGYSTTALLTTTCMTGQPAWAGTTPYTWQRCVIPIGQYIGQVPIFRFEFSSNASTSTYPGFYFDDMQIWGVSGQQAGIPTPCTNLAGNYFAPNVALTWTDPLVDTQGNPLTVDSVQVWLGSAGSGTYLGSVGPGVQSFTHVNAPIGIRTYSIRPKNDNFYGPPISVEVVVGTPGYINNFEVNGGDWTFPVEDGWLWGTPTNTAAPAPHSGASYWGTGLFANYSASACWQLDLNEGLVITSPTATLEFWQWYYTQTQYDGCNIKASIDNGATWTVLTPSQIPYYATALSTTNTCMGGQFAWSNTTPQAWENVVIPIGQYLGQAPIFRFEFSSNTSTQYTGYFFDDMVMWGVGNPTGMPRACTNLTGTYTSPNIDLNWTNPTQDTEGNALTVDSVQVWLGTPGNGTLLTTLAGNVQTYTHANAPIGIRTYSVRPINDGFSGQPTSIIVTVGTPGYLNMFETNNGNWIPNPEAGGWSWGTPTNGSAPAPYSGTGYWGTGLTANYPGSACWKVDLDEGLAVTSATAYVEFMYRFDSELTYDGCNFKVSTDDGQSWTIMTPSEGAYNITSASTANACMGGQPMWGGHVQTAWAHATIPIGQFLGQIVNFRLEFSSDPSVSGYMGFFFDDFVVWGASVQAGIPQPCTNLTATYTAPNVVLNWTNPTLDTQGSPVTLDSVQIWIGSTTTGTHVASVVGTANTYTHNSAPPGVYYYTIRPYHAPYFGSPTSTTNVTVGSPSYTFNFEENNGGWVSSGGGAIWQWGAPTVGTGGPAPHGGVNCWGTVLTGIYPNSACEYLDLNLGMPVTSPAASVNFWYWVDGEASYDGVNFKVSIDGGTNWTTITPATNGYQEDAFSTANLCTPSQPGWNGRDSTWRETVLPVGQFMGQTPIFRLTFGSDGSVQYRGFFFDDMVIWGLRPPSAIIGNVRSFGNNQAIPDVLVWAVGQPDTGVTDNNGDYVLPVEAGTYSVTFDQPHYCDTTYTGVVVTTGLETTRNAILRAPHGQVSRTSITMVSWLGVDTSDTFRIYNTNGQCPLDFAISDTSEWLTVNPASGTVNPNQSVVVTVTAEAPDEISEYSSDLTITGNTVGSPFTIRVDYSAADPANDPRFIPTEYAFYQNYPNPFNARTTLKFDVPQQSDVQIVIFNIMGQEVARPVQGAYAPGRYRVIYDAGDLPSGMYLLRMNAGNFEKIGKMMLLK
jgi:hypothetical protein